MKAAIALREGLGPGFMANAAACIATGLFYNEQDIIGSEIEGDYIHYIPITKIPIIIMKQTKPINELLKRAKKNKLKYMLFTKEAQSTTNYDEYIKRVEGKKIEEVDVIGLGVIGEEEKINKFAGDLPMLK